MVLDKLSYQHQTVAQQRKCHLLEQLDLAALLRVADQNWHDLSRALGLNVQVSN